MHKKQIAILYGGFISTGGGAYMHAKSLASGAYSNGWIPKVYTLDDLPFQLRYIPHLVEKFINLFAMPVGYYYKGIITSYLYRIFLNLKYDLVVFEDIYLFYKTQSPSLVVLHAVWSDNLQSSTVPDCMVTRLKLMELNKINKIDSPIVTVSKPYLDFLKKRHYHGHYLRELGVVELGIPEIDTYLNQVVNFNRKSIVYLGALEARKNLKFMLNIFSCLREKDPAYKFTIIGDGPERLELEELSKSHNLYVNFLGKLPTASVIKEFSKHGLYVHTSTKESFSYALLEAKLCNLTTFAYADLEVPDSFVDYKINFFDADLWASTILSESGPTHSIDSNFYSSEAMFLRLLRIYDDKLGLSDD